MMDFVITGGIPIPFAATLSPMELVAGVVIVTLWFLLYEELNK